MFVIKSIIFYEVKGRLAERSFHNEWSESIKSRVFGVTTALKIKGIFVGFTEFSDVERALLVRTKATIRVKRGRFITLSEEPVKQRLYVSKTEPEFGDRSWSLVHEKRDDDDNNHDYHVKDIS